MCSSWAGSLTRSQHHSFTALQQLQVGPVTTKESRRWTCTVLASPGRLILSQATLILQPPVWSNALH